MTEFKPTKTVVLISCVSKKLANAARACDLYISPLFKMNLQYAKSLNPDEIFILSSKIGLISLDEMIEPYDLTLNKIGSKEVKAWADRVIADLDKRYDPRITKFIFLAGENYRKFLLPRLRYFEIPMKGLQIGKQLSWLKKAIEFDEPCQPLERISVSNGSMTHVRPAVTSGSNFCNLIHELSRSMRRYKFPFDNSDLPKNGIYILFEQGESDHGGDRIVRVGNHTGIDQLPPRLTQHFMNPNKDRSIFRKNIGRAGLNQDGDPYLDKWEWDLTTNENKTRLLAMIDPDYQKEIETRVTDYIRERFTFSVFEIGDKELRQRLEARLISTISNCSGCGASAEWFGNHSTKAKIRESGLWQEQELYKTGLNDDEFRILVRAAV